MADGKMASLSTAGDATEIGFESNQGLGGGSSKKRRKTMASCSSEGSDDGGDSTADTAAAEAAAEAAAAEAAEPCSCGFHALYDPCRILALSDRQRWRVLGEAVRLALARAQVRAHAWAQLHSVTDSSTVDNTDSHPNNSSSFADVVVLDVADGSVCALLAAAAGCERVTSVETNLLSGMLWEQVSRYNVKLDSAKGGSESSSSGGSVGMIDAVDAAVHALTPAHLELLLGDEGGDEQEHAAEEGAQGAESVEGVEADEVDPFAAPFRPLDLLLAEPWFLPLGHSQLLTAVNFWLLRSTAAVTKLASGGAHTSSGGGDATSAASVDTRAGASSTGASGDGLVVMPYRAVLMAMAISSPELHQAYGDIASPCGLDHSIIDDAVWGSGGGSVGEAAEDGTCATQEGCPLCTRELHLRMEEYEYCALSNPVALLTLEYEASVIRDVQGEATLHCTSDLTNVMDGGAVGATAAAVGGRVGGDSNGLPTARCHGVVTWIEYILDSHGACVLSGGLKEWGRDESTYEQDYEAGGATRMTAFSLGQEQTLHLFREPQACSHPSCANQLGGNQIEAGQLQAHAVVDARTAKARVHVTSCR
jgi:hypothetical protein